MDWDRLHELLETEELGLPQNWQNSMMDVWPSGLSGPHGEIGPETYTVLQVIASKPEQSKWGWNVAPKDRLVTTGALYKSLLSAALTKGAFN